MATYYLVIKPDGNYLTQANTLSQARVIARDYYKQYGSIGWRFVKCVDGKIV